MTDSAEHLAIAIRQVIEKTVHALLRVQQPPQALPRDSLQKPTEKFSTDRMLYPLKNLQQMLSISRSTVYQLVGCGQVPSVTIGRRRFVTAAALHAYIEGLR